MRKITWGRSRLGWGVLLVLVSWSGCEVDRSGLSSSIDVQSQDGGAGGSVATGGHGSGGLSGGHGGTGGLTGAGGLIATGGSTQPGSGGQGGGLFASGGTGGTGTGGVGTGGIGTGGTGTGGVATGGVGGPGGTGGFWTFTGGWTGSTGGAGQGGGPGSGGAAGSGTGGAGTGSGGAMGGAGGDSGPHCGPDTCDGCCAGGQCVHLVSAAQCGSKGAACTACGPCQLCSGGACAIDPTSAWTIVADAAQVTTSPPGGGTWDPAHGDEGGSAPDLFCAYENPAGDFATAGVTSVAIDSFSATWNQTITPPGVTVTAAQLMAAKPAWRILVGDEDCATAAVCGTAEQVACTYQQPIDPTSLAAGQLTITGDQSCVSLTLSFACAAPPPPPM